MQRYLICVLALGLSACSASPNRSAISTNSTTPKDDCLTGNVFDCAIIHTPVKP